MTAPSAKDFESERLGDISHFITKGATPTTYGFHWQSTGVRFLRSECVSDHGLDLRQSMFISEAANQSLRRSHVTDGDILITITGNVGRVIRLVGLDRGNINQHIARIRIKGDRFDAGYVYHFLSQVSVRQHFEKIVTGQAYPQISLKQVRDAQVMGPPIDGQRGIAGVLDDVDGFIRAIERLVDKKEAIKQGMMQQLLTGRIRLRGFTGTWAKRPIGEMVCLRSGRPRTQSPGGRYWIVDMGSVTRDGEFVVSKKTTCGDDFLAPGELVMPKDDIGGGHIIGRTGLIDRESTYVLADHVYALTPRSGVDPAFLNLAINGHEVNSALRNLATGSAQLGLSRASVARQRVCMPANVEEQRGIARVINDAAAEIASLHARLAKARSIKTGMMQKLLTGQTRLPFKETEL
jgi:type I restriction enzyme, S subunit